MTIVEKLRHHANTLRTNSVPLKDLIPLLQQAADELEALNSQLDAAYEDIRQMNEYIEDFS